jgi:hypothetical protein
MPTELCVMVHNIRCGNKQVTRLSLQYLAHELLSHAQLTLPITTDFWYVVIHIMLSTMIKRVHAGLRQ